MLKVALNPFNQNANSFWSSETGVNLFLGSPISDDISESENMTSIIDALNSGTLIVVSGDVPGEINPPEFVKSRSRWAKEDNEGKPIEYPKDVLKTWNKFMASRKKK